MDRSSSGTKTEDKKANDQFLDLRYLSTPKGQPKHHYHPIKPPCLSAVLLGGCTQEQIGAVVEISQGRVAQIINNTSFGKINNLLTQGRERDYIASHYHMDLALARQTYGGLARADPCPIGRPYAFFALHRRDTFVIVQAKHLGMPPATH